MLCIRKILKTKRHKKVENERVQDRKKKTPKTMKEGWNSNHNSGLKKKIKVKGKQKIE